MPSAGRPSLASSAASSLADSAACHAELINAVVNRDAHLCAHWGRRAAELKCLDRRVTTAQSRHACCALSAAPLAYLVYHAAKVGGQSARPRMTHRIRGV
eukprot:1793151-Prymnesium_polylepis.2